LLKVQPYMHISDLIAKCYELIRGIDFLYIEDMDANIYILALKACILRIFEMPGANETDIGNCLLRHLDELYNLNHDRKAFAWVFYGKLNPLYIQWYAQSCCHEHMLENAYVN